jgi:excisionase family DNA binding protein
MARSSATGASDPSEEDQPVTRQETRAAPATSAGQGVGQHSALSPRAPGNTRTPRGEMLYPAEVAAIFRVDPKTVTRWAKIGKIRSVKTPGGHRRYFRDEIMAMLEDGSDS